jgi:hypothetical protein
MAYFAKDCHSSAQRQRRPRHRKLIKLDKLNKGLDSRAA